MLFILCCIVGVGEEEVRLAVPILGTGFGCMLIELSGDSASAVYVLRAKIFI